MSGSHTIQNAIFILALLFLAFVGGALASVGEVYPTGYLRDAYRAGVALYEKRSRAYEHFASDLWDHARGPERGVTVHDSTRAASGLTLYSSGHVASARLIDMDGHVVHEWTQPYSEIWDDSAAPRNPVPDDHTYLRKTHVFPNGDLLAIYDGVGDSPYGYGMVKLDADSEVIWKNLDHFHHSFALADDGRIYGLTHGYRHDVPVTTRGWEVDHLRLPYLDDYLVVLSADGEELQRISLIDAVNNSDYRSLLWQVAGYSLEDPLHTNDVDLLDAEAAAWLAQKVPVARAGQVLLSFRELGTGTIALLDVEEAVIVWALHGSWLSHHDPDVLPNGNILMFDNRGHFGEGGKSRVIEIDPSTGGIVWSYTGDADNPLDSAIRAEQERLDNGNTLITEANPGRLVEVTPEGDIVWEYFNPARGGETDELIATVSWAQRIDPEGYFDSEFIARLQADTFRDYAEVHRP